MDQILHQDEVESLACALWDTWGRTSLEVISEVEFAECTGLDRELGNYLSWMLSRFDKHKHISLSGLTECLRILQGNSMVDRVWLLFTFMDVDRSGRISHTNMQKYLWMVDDKVSERLSFTQASDVVYEDLLRVFQNSARGEAAISLFCNQVLKLLCQSGVNVTSHSETPSPAQGSSLKWFDRIYCLKGIITSQPTKEQVFIYVLVLLQIVFWLVHFFYYLHIRHMSLSFCVAKGFGLNLRVITIAMYGTMMRRTMGYLYHYSRLRPCLPLGFNVQMHSFLGFSLVFHALGHMGGHIVYYQRHVKGGFAEAFAQESLLRTRDWTRRGKGDAITGKFDFSSSFPM